MDWGPYVFSGNRVIDAIELEGLEPVDFRVDQKAKRVASGEKTTKTEVVAGVAIAAAGVGAVSILTYGLKAVVSFVLNEVKDEVLSQMTDGASDFADVSKSGVKILKEGAEMLSEKAVKKTGGRLGNEATRAQNSNVASELESRGFEITGGGGRLPEEYIPAIGGGRKGSSYPDITATKDGQTLRVNTVDTRKKTGTMTTREANNAARIRKQKPNDHLVTIPKQK